MKIVVAMDSFKGSLSSLQAGSAVREAALQADPQAEVVIKPLADGGEGTVAALSCGLGGERIECTVQGPRGKAVTAAYCILKETKTAVIEMAAAAGLPLLSPAERNPLETSTFGVGQLIGDAIERGCRRFIIGIGGSATNDGGMGMLRALGYEFLDSLGAPVPLGAKGLKDLKKIKTDGVHPALSECFFQIACDVTNPLCGEQGCSAVFAPQKGATPQMVRQMDEWLLNYALLAEELFEKAQKDVPGAGAAGGLGFAFLAFTKATLQSGVQLVLEEVGLEEEIKAADLVVTGEGRMDGQTLLGKAPIGVATLAKKYQKRVIAFCGSATKDAILCHGSGIDAFFPILREITSLEEALDPQNAYENLKGTAEQVFRLLKK